jgi:hypothetical protein
VNDQRRLAAGDTVEVTRGLDTFPGMVEESHAARVAWSVSAFGLSFLDRALIERDGDCGTSRGRIGG